MAGVKKNSDINLLTVTVLISSALTLLVLYVGTVPDPEKELATLVFKFDEVLQNIDTQDPTPHPETILYVVLPVYKEDEEDIDDKENDYFRFGKPLPGADQIFFIESSCIASNKSGVDLDTSKLELTDIEVCAVESAARTNVEKNIFILYTCPLDPLFSIERSSSRVQNLLDQYNVYVWQPKLSLLFANTPLENFFMAHLQDLSRLQQKYGNELLSYLVLWRFGGIYMDMNFVAMRSFAVLGDDFVVMADQENVHPGVLALGAMGKTLAVGCLKELETRILRDDDSGIDGGVLTTALKDTCNIKMISVTNQTRDCQGVAIVASDEFVSVNTRSDWNSTKNDQHDSEILKKISGKTAFRVLHDEIPFQNSFPTKFTKKPFAILLRDYCPLLVGV